MVWDLSSSVPGVFRSPGNPLINLFHLLFNINTRPMGELGLAGGGGVGVGGPFSRSTMF